MKLRNLFLILSIFLLGCQKSDSIVDENPIFPEVILPSKPVLESLIQRVSVQTEIAEPEDIFDHRWVGVGIKRDYAIMRSHAMLYNGKPSYRFELRQGDNSLDGYNDGESKGRAEISYCYATAQDYEGVSTEIYEQEQIIKNVYHRGKGSCQQGDRMLHKFAIFVPDTISEDAHTILAQWHGMPTRTLACSPEKEVVELTYAEFLAMEDTTIFQNDTGYQKIKVVDSHGNIKYKKGEKTGWLIEQGGYPPLAFGFNSGFFYIKANSDARWFTDKTDRTNANVERFDIMQAVSSEYKTSTIAYKMPIDEFPKNCWVEFDIEILWSTYCRATQKMITNGELFVQYHTKDEDRILVDHEKLPLGRNDESGYYFKMGIYRTSSSETPVCYYMGGYEERVLSKGELQ